MKPNWLICTVTVLLGCSAAAADQDRQAEVAARGAQVMPFKLSATTHIFRQDTAGRPATGGCQGPNSL